MDALMNFMFTMNGTFTQQVIEQVRRVIEVTTSARPTSHFDYVPTADCEPSHRHIPIVSHHYGDEGTEAARPDRNSRSRGDHRDRPMRADAPHSHHPS